LPSTSTIHGGSRTGWSSAATITAPHAEGDEDQVYHCGGGLNSFAIDPNGRLRLCSFSQQEHYDLRAGSFMDGWEHFLKQVRFRRVTRVTKCTHCHLKAMCGMCPATAALESGDPEEPVDFLCQVAHLRAMALGLAIPEHGPCEYCAGGTRRELLAESLDRLMALPEGRKAAAYRQTVFLPMIGQAAGGCGSGGCGSCAA
jgi:radical SAM protein with 4Fe4S-binding SPASM domain